MVRKTRLYFRLRSLSSLSLYRVRNRSHDTNRGDVPSFQKRGKYFHLYSPSFRFVVGNCSPRSMVVHVVEASLALTPAMDLAGARADARLDKNCHNFDSNSTPDAFVALE